MFMSIVKLSVVTTLCRLLFCVPCAVLVICADVAVHYQFIIGRWRMIFVGVRCNGLIA